MGVVAICSAFALFLAAQKPVKMYLIGDSTMYTYKASEYPMTGWGQVFSLFFRQGTVSIDNRAIGGRSSRMFYTEDRWKTIVNLLQAGDYVVIQFGHNDRDYSKEERYTDTADFKKYLRLFIQETRAKSAIPVLVSPMNMNTWNGTTVREVFCENANDYRGAMLQVARELTVPFVDLEKKSAALMQQVGQTYCTSFHFLGLQSGEYPNYPDGKADGTHFQEMGSLANARMVAEGIKELEDNEEIQPIASLLAPLKKVTIASNKMSAAVVSVSGTYPAGATITLKVMPKTGETFEKWVDDKGVAVATTVRHSFTMGENDTAFTAVFKGGSTDVREMSAITRAEPVHQPLTIAVVSGSLMIRSAYPVRQVRIITPGGKIIRRVNVPQLLTTEIPLAGVSEQTLFVQVQTQNGTCRSERVPF